jgi:hypothetical protein
VGKVATRRQVQTHDAGVGVQQCCVHCEVGRGSGVRLDVDTPVIRAKTVRLKSTLNAEVLDLIVVEGRKCV